MKQILRQQGVVHDIQVIEQRGIRYLRFGDGGGWQGALRLRRKEIPVFPYQRAFAAVAPVLLPEQGAFLSFGVGTGTSLRAIQALHPDAELFGVELDERVLDVAIAQFEAPNHHEATYWVGDGLEFIQRVPNTFDCIFLDAYLSNRNLFTCTGIICPWVVAHSAKVQWGRSSQSHLSDTASRPNERVFDGRTICLSVGIHAAGRHAWHGAERTGVLYRTARFRKCSA